jgi:transcription elongation GreA/GreB family factor
MSTHKQKLHTLCLEHIARRIHEVRQALALLQLSANEETKSSAGDKYETGRAMAQHEMEKLGTQLTENMKLRQIVEKIDPTRVAEVVQLGGAVKTSQGNFYVAVSAGVLGTGADAFIAISPASPIGAKLMGCKAGDVFEFNKKVYSVDAVE